MNFKKMTPKEKAKKYHESIISQNPQAEAWGFDAAFLEGYTEGYADSLDLERVPSKDMIKKIIHLRNNWYKNTNFDEDEVINYIEKQLYDDFKISDSKILEEPCDSIVLTTYFDDYEYVHNRFINMLKNQENYKNSTPEQLEQVWLDHIHSEYTSDEIWDIIQCEGYTKIVLKMGRHDIQHDYDLVCETKEYIESKIKL